MIVNNPIMWIDMPDPDLIRVRDTYYMVSTTMFVMPGGPILKSKDLYHWELVSYIFNTIEDNEIYCLENGKHAYGKGQWATSLKHHNGRFYACFVCHDLQRTFIYYTEDIEKSGWERYVINDVFHDMSFLFDDDGKAYLIYGNGDIRIVELNENISGIKKGGINQLLFSTPTEDIGLRCEGCRAYKLNGYYYLLFIEWPRNGNARRRQVCYRSMSLLGEYERKIILDDDMGYQNNGVAQGALIDTVDGKWYTMLFQDHGAVGRIPYLLPAIWEDGWPVVGIDGKVPKSFEVPFEEYIASPLIISDSFCHDVNIMDSRWEWNHNPDDSCWSFTDNPGYLRLYAKYADKLLSARNTLTQRTSGPTCEFIVTLSTRGMKPGDFAGLVALQGNFGAIGVKVLDKGERKLVSSRRIDGGDQKDYIVNNLKEDNIRFKIAFDFIDSKDIAAFYYYDTEKAVWVEVQDRLKMKYTLDLFIGYRVGLFCYSDKEDSGFADFTDFQYLPGIEL